jgi:hypothetical protein
VVKVLNISGSAVTSAACKNIAASCKYLETLYIARCEDVTSLAEALEVGLDLLTELDVSECSIEDAGLVRLSKCQHLRYLSLSNLDVGDFLIQSEVAHLHSLT